jgi:oxygen-independent coproporphyrinogen-3 oxidase
MRSVYLHFPFCRSRCTYCDFVSGIPPEEDIVRRYSDALLRELPMQAERFGGVAGKSTLYLGGGTPSLAPVREIARWVEAAAKIAPGGFAETTLEANPEDVTPSLAREWKKLGIDRTSLGWQSQNAGTLTSLLRRNSPGSNIRALDALHEAGFTNVSVDVIAGIAGDDLSATLDAVTKARPEHVSVYMLTIAEGTPLHRSANAGSYVPLGEKASLAALRRVNERLNESGYERYEVSNWALSENFRSKHNENYWKYGEYFGAGLSASGFMRTGNAPFAGMRWSNGRNLREWLNEIENGRFDREIEEEIGLETAIREYLMVSLRLTRGPDAEEFRSLFGVPLFDAIIPRFFDINAGLVDRDERGFRLTERGFELSNPVTVSLWENLN